MQDNQFREVTKLQKEYIDAAACREDFMNAVYDICSDDDTNDRANQIIDVFDSLPAADVAEITRCKNCIYGEFGKDYTPYCNNENGLATITEQTSCSYGVRKDVTSK